MSRFRARTRVVGAEALAAAPLAEPPLVSPATSVSLRDRASQIVAHRAFPVATLVAIVVVAALVNALVAIQQRVPNLFPDEIVYGKLAQSLAAGDGLSWRGIGWGVPPLWPALLSLVWHTDTVQPGYEAAKVLGAIVSSTAAIPVWLFGRRVCGPRVALVAALLVMLGPWMQVTQFIVSENLAFPLATAALMATVQALRDSRTRWVLIALGFSLVAILTRTQMLMLPVIIFGALAVDCLARPREEWRTHFDSRPPALWLALGLLVGGGLLAFLVEQDLTSYDVLATNASVSDLLDTAKDQITAGLATFAFLPVVLVAALMSRRRNWRDDDLRPVLVTLAVATVVVFAVVVRFDAFATAGAPVDRYVMYLAPLLMLAAVMAPGRIGFKTTAAWGVIAAAAMLVAPVAKNFVEQPGLFGVQKRIADVGNFTSGNTKVATAAAVLVLMVAAARAVTVRPQRALTIGAVVMGALLLALSWSSRSYNIDVAKTNRTVLLPKQLNWVDVRAKGRVGMLSLGKSLTWRQNPDLLTEFFNKKISAVYSGVPFGNGVCSLGLSKKGELFSSGAACKSVPSQLLITPGAAVVTLHQQRVIASSATRGSLVRVGPNKPRMFALVAPPCSAFGCTGELGLAFYSDEAGKVAVTFGPSPVEQQIQTGQQVQKLPPNRPTTLNFDVPAGSQSVNLPVSWSDRAGPPLLSVILKTKTTRTRVY